MEGLASSHSASVRHESMNSWSRFLLMVLNEMSQRSCQFQYPRVHGFMGWYLSSPSFFQHTRSPITFSPLHTLSSSNSPLTYCCLRGRSVLA